MMEHTFKGSIYRYFNMAIMLSKYKQLYYKINK